MLLKELIETIEVSVKGDKGDMFVANMLGRKMTDLGGRLVPNSSYTWAFSDAEVAKKAKLYADAFMRSHYGRS